MAQFWGPFFGGGASCSNNTGIDGIRWEDQNVYASFTIEGLVINHQRERVMVMKIKVPILILSLMAMPLSADECESGHDYLRASEKAVDFLVSQLQSNGSYKSTDDLAAYYKLPTTLYAAGRVEEAGRVVDYILERFLQPNGDLLTGEGDKSADAALTEYYHYTNAWVAMGAQRLGRFDMAQGLHPYLLGFYNKHQGGFNTSTPYHPSDKDAIVTDTLSTSHGGLLALYFGDMEKAKTAGDLLLHMIAVQPDLSAGFYERIDRKGDPITEFSAEKAAFYFVSASESNQAYFFVGYPIAYLGLLYRATGEQRYLAGAQAYLSWVLSTSGNVRSFFFSHKVGWGAAIIANITGNTTYARLACDIADHLVSIQQPNGQFLPELGVFTSFDQSAEIALWLRYIHAELKSTDLLH